MTNNQLYTHSNRFGVCIGQRWKLKQGIGLSGIVVGITYRGYVLLDHSPKLVGNSRIPIDELVRDYGIVSPVSIQLYQQVNGRVCAQIKSTDPESTGLIVGEIQRNFDDRDTPEPFRFEHGISLL